MFLRPYDLPKKHGPKTTLGGGEVHHFWLWTTWAGGEAVGMTPGLPLFSKCMNKSEGIEKICMLIATKLIYYHQKKYIYILQLLNQKWEIDSQVVFKLNFFANLFNQNKALSE